MKRTIWQRCRLTFELFPEIAPTVWAVTLYGGTMILLLAGISLYAMPSEELEGFLKLLIVCLGTWRLVVWVERSGRRPRAGYYRPGMTPPGFVGPRPAPPTPQPIRAIDPAMQSATGLRQDP